MKVLAIGDNCIDDYIVQRKKYVGGCSVNFSIYMQELGNESAYLGIVGNDENGYLVADTMKKRKVDISHLKVKKGQTAVTEVELIDGDRKFKGYTEGVLKEIELSESDMNYIGTFDLVHTSVFGNIEMYLSEIKKRTIVCYDFGDKLDRADREKIFTNIDYAFFSYSQIDDYIKQYLKTAVFAGVKCAIATLGENGSIAYDGNRFYKCGIKKVRVVDTIGAGDSFIAGFMNAKLYKNGIVQCLEAGSEKAASTLQHFGAI